MNEMDIVVVCILRLEIRRIIKDLKILYLYHEEENRNKFPATESGIRQIRCSVPATVNDGGLLVGRTR